MMDLKIMMRKVMMMRKGRMMKMMMRRMRVFKKLEKVQEDL